MYSELINVFGSQTAPLWATVQSNPNIHLGNASALFIQDVQGRATLVELWNTTWSTIGQLPACTQYSAACQSNDLGIGALWQVCGGGEGGGGSAYGCGGGGGMVLMVIYWRQHKLQTKHASYTPPVYTMYSYHELKVHSPPYPPIHLHPPPYSTTFHRL